MVVLLVGSLAAAGCGGPRKVDRKAFVDEAGRICAHFSQLQNQVQFPSTDPTAASTTHAARAEWAVSLKQVAYLGTQEVKELRKLTAPDELAASFVVLVGRMDAAYADLLRAADAAKRNDVPRLKRNAASGRAKLNRLPALAARAGLPRCG